MATLGERLPDLAQELGVDVEKLQKEAGGTGHLSVVTFREAHYDIGSRTDPVADLPPSFRSFGIVDRRHRDRVKPGETWIVQAYTMDHVKAVFLVPAVEIDLAAVLTLDQDLIQKLAKDLATMRPDLVRAVGELLSPTKGASEEEARELRAGLESAQAALRSARRALAGARQSVVAALDDAAGQVAEAAGRLDVPAPKGETEEPSVAMRRRDKGRRSMPLYLADANVFINAERNQRRQCQRILEAAGERLRLATTRAVYNELRYGYHIPKQLVILDVGPIDDRLRHLADANASARGKKAGDNDLSLVQALLEHPEARGIITEDPDIVNLHPASLVREMAGRDVECLPSAMFCERHKKLVPA